ncbi:hypothetical protein U9M48_036638, partial [Paspalum notatum var. saurae]
WCSRLCLADAASLVLSSPFKSRGHPDRILLPSYGSQDVTETGVWRRRRDAPSRRARSIAGSLVAPSAALPLGSCLHPSTDYESSMYPSSVCVIGSFVAASWNRILQISNHDRNANKEVLNMSRFQ